MMPIACSACAGDTASISDTIALVPPRSMPHHWPALTLIAREISFCVPELELRTKYSAGSVHGAALLYELPAPNTTWAISALIVVWSDDDGTTIVITSIG